MPNWRTKQYSPSFGTLAFLVIGSFLSLCIALFGLYLGSRAYEANNLLPSPSGSPAIEDPGAASDTKTRFSADCQDTNNP